MRLTTLLSRLILATAWPASATPLNKTKGVSTEVYNRLVHFATIAQATYVDARATCNITGLPRLATILNSTTDIHGWLLHDDASQELIVAFMGTSSQLNFDQDGNYTLGAIETLPSCVGCKAHGGYYLDWLSVNDQIKGLLRGAVEKYPSYGIVITGHRQVATE